MQLYIGVDFHPHQQTACWCDRETGELKFKTLLHNLKEVRAFYQNFPPAVIGIEASSKAGWFEDLLSSMGHQLKVGNPSLIRKRATSRHKSDRRDAELIFTLLLKDEFPAIWRRSRENTEVLEILKMRLNLVKQRTQIYNQLQALAHDFGLEKGKMQSLYFQALVKSVETAPTTALRRRQLFELLDYLTRQIRELEEWLKSKAQTNEKVQLLMTQKGVGYMTALAVVNALGDISRFSRPAKQVPAFIGLEPLEDESAGKRKAGQISRAGNSVTRYLLGQSANIVARYDPSLKSFYKRLAKGKPKPVAKSATARKVLVKLSIMLRENISATEFDRRGRTVNDARNLQGLQ